MKQIKKNKIKAHFLHWLNGDISLSGAMETNREGKKYEYTTSERSVWEPKPAQDVERTEIRSFEKIYIVLAVVLCTLIISVLFVTVFNMPLNGTEDRPTNNEVEEKYIEDGLSETGAVSAVAGMILDYRAFDTLGESHVLFTGLCAVFILMLDEKNKTMVREFRREDRIFDTKRDVIITVMAKFVVPAVFLFGIYVILNGHLSPGGGFSGGTIIGAGLILHSIAFGFEKTSLFMNRKVLKIVTLIALAFYSLAKGYSFYMGANHLENGIPLGIPGNIISSGLILPLNIAVGLVVACTMYGLYSVFRRGKI